MGLKNYTEQSALIARTAVSIQFLKSYADAMQQINTEISANWSGKGDKYNIQFAIQECAKEAVDIANAYDSFSTNAKRRLEEMNDLDKLTKAFVSNVRYGNPVDIVTRSNYSRMIINPDTLSGYVTKIKGYSNQLQECSSGTKYVSVMLDKLILQSFTSRYSLGNIKNRIDDLINKNNKVADSIQKISEKYKQAEGALIQIANALTGDIYSRLVQDATNIMQNVMDANHKNDWTPVDIEKIIESQYQWPNDSHIKNIIKKIKESDTIENIIDEIKDTVGIGKIEDVIETIEKLKSGDYIGILEDIADEVVDDLYNPETGEVNTGALKAKSVIIISRLVTQEDSYLLNNLHKYGMRPDMGKLFVNGKYYEVQASIAISFVQVLGKGVVDAGCKLIDSLIDSTPGGKVLDYVNAICNDLFGTSPEKEFNKLTQKISEGVDYVADKYVEVAGKADEMRIKVGNEIKDVYSDVKKVVSKNIKSAISSIKTNIQVGEGAGGGGAKAW